MSEASSFDLDPIAQEIFDLMRRQPGDIFSAESLATQLDDAEPEITTRLAQLERLGLVERAMTGDAPAYILSPSAPEL